MPNGALDLEIILRLLLGAVMGGIIGFEREAHGRPAGFRTHLLVCLSSVLIMLISHNHFRFMPIDPAYMRMDPARIVSGAITGIGFLGAGVIIKTRGSIYGLTTAASIWIVFTLGLAIGSGLYAPAAATFTITYFTLWTLRLVEKKIPKVLFRSVQITGSGSLDEDAVRAVIVKFGSVAGIEYEKDIDKNGVKYEFSVSLQHDAPLKDLIGELSKLEGARTVKLGVTF
ncbi:MAG: MgtC/SapB family protein [Nitrospiraceae bacterium]|nr:MgtC/SapB family protein [Nitrospiraceae bacterium]